MKLLVDIGNTNTSMVLLRNGRFVKRRFIRTARENISPAAFKRLMEAYVRHIDGIVAVSVVPDFLALLKENLKKAAPGIPLSVVGEDIEVPIRNLYRNPAEVGQDRLVTSFAAGSILGWPVMSIDFGTAVTMDFVDKKGAYLGGLIFPGLRPALASLVKNTALLPKVAIKPVSGFVGRDTRGSMNNGILYGYAAMCDGIIEKSRGMYGKGLKVIATGGDAGLVAKYSRHMKRVYPDLIFEGLRLTIAGSIEV